MSARNGFLDEQGMTELARKSIEILRQDGTSPTELRRLEMLLKDGNVGEAFILSSLLRTIQSLVDLSQNLFDIDAWQHYRESGYESFEKYCEKMLGVPTSKIQGLKRIKDQPLPRPKKAGPVELFAWFFNVIENLVTSETGRGR